MHYFKLLPLICLLFTACSNENTSTTTSTSTKGQCELLSVEDFGKAISTTKVQLVDVRTPKEHNDGAIPNSVNIDFYKDDFSDLMNKSLDKSKPVYVYCKSGGRSGKTCNKLVNEGFTQIYDLQGGYTAWQKKRN